MAEQRLDVPQVCTAADQMRRAGMAQRMRCESHTQSTTTELDARPETDRAGRAPGAGEEERRFGASYECGRLSVR